MASLRGAVPLSAPTVPVFGVAMALAVLALLMRYLGVDIPGVTPFETLLAAFAVLALGVLVRGL